MRHTLILMVDTSTMLSYVNCSYW